LVFFDLNSARRASRIAGWLLLGTIAALSLAPASYRPVSGLGHNWEHFFVHVLLGLAFGIGYARRWWFLSLGLVASTGAIEVAQLFVPGRHARMRDFLIDAAAVCLGLGLAWLSNGIAGRMLRRSGSEHLKAAE
jgi:VanZ family protein